MMDAAAGPNACVCTQIDDPRQALLRARKGASRSARGVASAAGSRSAPNRRQTAEQDGLIGRTRYFHRDTTLGPAARRDPADELIVFSNAVHAEVFARFNVG